MSLPSCEVCAGESLQREKITPNGRRSGFYLALCVSAAFLVSTGCRGCHRPERVALPDPDDFQKNQVSKSSSIEINFYLDTTQSMRGYLGQPEGRKNYFNEILDKATGILKEGWTDARVHFWGFGKEKPEPIDLRSFLGKPGAFTGTNTYIEKAIQHEPPVPQQTPQAPLPRLKIILTDLFQEGNDLDHLAVFLSDYLRDASRAVGIIGLRNPFDGDIADLPGNQSLPKGAADTLPFYVMVAGPVADVNLALAELTRRLDLGGLPKDQKFALVFAQRQVTKLTQPLDLHPARLEKPGYTLEDNRVPGSAELGIPYLAGVKGDLRLRAANFPSPALSRIGSHIRVGSQPDKKAFVWSNNAWTAAPQPASALSVDSAKGAVSVDHSKLMKGSIYLFEIDFAAEPGDFSDLSPWYLELNDVPRIIRNRAFDQHQGGSRPGKTPNLRHFLQTISSKMFQSPIPLARYYFYVQAQ